MVTAVRESGESQWKDIWLGNLESHIVSLVIALQCKFYLHKLGRTSRSGVHIFRRIGKSEVTGSTSRQLENILRDTFTPFLFNSIEQALWRGTTAIENTGSYYILLPEMRRILQETRLEASAQHLHSSITAKKVLRMLSAT